jgi:hypothetical protein
MKQFWMKQRTRVGKVGLKQRTRVRGLQLGLSLAKVKNLGGGKHRLRALQFLFV